MTTGCILGACLFIAAALLSSKNVLWLPAVVLIAAAAANVFAEVM
jgi:hypothetical protein